MRVSGGALFLALLASGCHPVEPPVTHPAFSGGGLLVVYLQPLPPAAARLKLTLQALRAVRGDGTSLPLTMAFTDLDRESAGRERRLAARGLPAGRYTGLAAGVAAASREEGEAGGTLQVPADPVSIPVPFTIEERRAVVLTLGIDPRQPVEPGSRFAPAFTASHPRRPAPDLIALASSRGSDSVTLFDKISGRIAGIIPIAGSPSGLALDRARRRVYVAATGSDTIEAIGVLEQATLAHLGLRGGDAPVELALTPDGGTLLAVNTGSSTVSVIAALPMVETARVAVGDSPVFLLMDRLGRRAYTFNTASGTISVIDVAARAVAGTIATEAGPIRGDFSAAGDRLYVIHRTSPYLLVIDPITLSETARVHVGTGVTAIKVDPQSGRIYLANRLSASIDIYDPLSLLPVDAIPVDGTISHMTIDEEGNNLYLVLPGTGEVRILRIVSKAIVARADVGEAPYDTVLAGER